MKCKLLFIVSLQIMLVANTEIAMANPAEVHIAKNPNPFNIADGNIDESTVTINAIDYSIGSPQTRYLTATTSSGSSVSIRVCNIAGDSTCYGSTLDTGWSSDTNPATTTHKFTYTASSPNSYTYSVYVKGISYDKVLITDNEGNAYLSSASSDYGSASASAPIPEFPIVALPVGVSIGLVLFFHQRKNTEENL